MKKTQIMNINNERGNIIIDPNDINRTINKYYKQFHVNNFNNKQNGETP